MSLWHPNKVTRPDYSIIPARDNLFDLGRPEFRWRHLYPIDIRTPEDSSSMVSFLSHDGEQYQTVATMTMGIFTINRSHHIIPFQDNIAQLGEPTKRWANIYTALLNDWNPDAHASRHLSGGEDALAGWISPSHIGPRSDTAAEILWRTRDIGDNYNVDHKFRPQSDLYGYLGTESYRFFRAFILDSFWWGGYARGEFTTYFPYDYATHYTLKPVTDGYSYIGTPSNRFNLVRAVTITQGDLGFEEDRCMVCGKPFKPNDSIVLKVRKIDKENKQILTVPVHAECNPHKLSEEMLEHHEKNVLASRKNQQDEQRYKMPNPEIGFEIVWESPINEELMYVQAKFEDGISVCPTIRIDASENEVINAIKEAYLHEKERVISEYEAKKKGEEKLKKRGKTFKGYKGRLTLRD